MTENRQKTLTPDTPSQESTTRSGGEVYWNMIGAFVVDGVWKEARANVEALVSG